MKAMKLLLPKQLIEAVVAGDREMIVASATTSAQRPIRHNGELSSHRGLREFLKRQFAAALLGDFTGMPSPIPEVQPIEAPNALPEKRRTAPPAPPSLLAHIARMGGIAWSEVLDLTGESKPIIRPGLFRKSGIPLDDLATRLRDDGFDIPQDSADGGVQALRDMIRDELDGRRKHYSFAGTERAIELEYYSRLMAEAETELEAS